MIRRVPPTRRSLLGLGAAALAGAAVSACGGGDDDGERRVGTLSESEAEGDVAVLNTLLDFEHTAVAAYTTAAAALRGDARTTASVFAGHERAHARALERAVRRLGGAPNRPRPAGEYAAGFPPLRGEDAALDFLLDVEDTGVAAYLDALPKLAAGEVRETAAAILTTEAGHGAVLLGALGRPQVPKAFVTGDV